jgi:hypothetical protein
MNWITLGFPVRNTERLSKSFPLIVEPCSSYSFLCATERFSRRWPQTLLFHEVLWRDLANPKFKRNSFRAAAQLMSDSPRRGTNSSRKELKEHNMN